LRLLICSTVASAVSIPALYPLETHMAKAWFFWASSCSSCEASSSCSFGSLVFSALSCALRYCSSAAQYAA
jgi:hypothetical protein